MISEESNSVLENRVNTRANRQEVRTLMGNEGNYACNLVRTVLWPLIIFYSQENL